MGARYVPIILQVQDATGRVVVAQLQNAFKGLETQTQSTASGMSNVFLKADLMARGIARVTQEVLQIVRDGVAEFLQFGREISNLNTLLDKSDSVDRYRQGLMNLDPSLGKTSELARGMYQAISSGVDSADALDFIEKSAKAARAGLATTFETVDAGTSVMASFNVEAKNAGEIYDKMFEVVKRGKIEMPALASSIGMVSSIAAQAGVSLDEMFAAIATSSRTLRPESAITGYRAALEAIIKPQADARDLARELGIEFNSQALKSKGFAQFLKDIETATKGDIAQMSVLFPEVRGLAFVMSIAGNQSKQFSEDLKGVAAASGTVEEAFQKQQESVSAQLDIMKVSIEKKFLAVFGVVEPYLIGFLKLTSQIQGPLGILALVIGGLVIAQTLYNTQLALTVLSWFPAFIKSVGSVIFWMIHFRTALTDSQVALAAFAGYAGLIAAAIGIVIYAVQSYESAADAANKITLDSINAQAKSFEESKSLAQAAQEVANAQAGSADRHEKLNAVLGRLDPVTREYIKSLKDEKDQIAVLNAEIDKNVQANKIALEAKLQSIGAGIVDQKNQIGSAEDQINRLQAQIVEYRRVIAANPDLATQRDFNELITARSKYIGELRDQIDKLNQSLSENDVKLLSTVVSLGLNRDQIVHFFEATGHAREEIAKVMAEYDRAIAATNKHTDATKDNAAAVNGQAEAIAKVNDALQRLLKTGDVEINQKIYDIVNLKKNAAESKKLAQEELRNNEQLRNLVEERKNYTQSEKVVREVFEPREAKTSRADSALADRIKEARAGIQQLAADFQARFGASLKYHFGQTAMHTSQNYDHRAAADISIDPRTAAGQWVVEYLRERGIAFRASVGKEISKTTGKIVSTGPHIHFGALSRGFGAGGRGAGLYGGSGVEGGLLTDAQLEAAISQAQEARVAEQMARLGLFIPPSRVKGEFFQNLLRQGGSFTDVLTGEKFAGAPLKPLTTATGIPQIYLNAPKLTKDQEYLAARKQEFDYDKALEDAVQRRRHLESEAHDDYEKNKIAEFNLDLDLAKLRMANADAQMVEQRRLLSAKSEQFDLETRISKVQDDIATGPYNESLRIQLALLEDIADMRRRDEEAIIATNRAQLELADSTTYHAAQANAKVLEFLAHQKNITKIVADAKTGAIQTAYDYLDSALGRVNTKLGRMGDLLTDIESALIRLALNKFFPWLFGGQGNGGSSPGLSPFGSGTFSNGRNAVTGGFAGGQGAGSYLQNIVAQRSQSFFSGLNPGGGGSGDGGITAPTTTLSSQAGGGWNSIKSKAASAGSATLNGPANAFSLGDLKASLGSASPLLGLSLGMQLGGQSRLGTAIGGIGGLLAGGSAAAFLLPSLFGVGTAGGSSALMAGAFSFLTNPFTIAALPLILFTAWKLGQLAQRRKDETKRAELSGNVYNDTIQILNAVRSGSMTSSEAMSQYAQVKSNYFAQVAQMKDAKTKRIATEWWNRDFDPVYRPLIEKAGKEADAAKSRASKLQPEFRDGGAIFSQVQSMRHLRFADGARLAPFVGRVPGVYDRRDNVNINVSGDEVVLAPKHWKPIVPYLQAAKVPGFGGNFADGGALAQPTFGAATGPLVIEITLGENRVVVGDEAAGDIVVKGVKSSDARKAIVKVNRADQSSRPF